MGILSRQMYDYHTEKDSNGDVVGIFTYKHEDELTDPSKAEKNTKRLEKFYKRVAERIIKIRDKEHKAGKDIEKLFHNTLEEILTREPHKISKFKIRAKNNKNLQVLRESKELTEEFYEYLYEDLSVESDGYGSTRGSTYGNCWMAGSLTGMVTGFVAGIPSFNVDVATLGGAIGIAMSTAYVGLMEINHRRHRKLARALCDIEFESTKRYRKLAKA